MCNAGLLHNKRNPGELILSLFDSVISLPVFHQLNSFFSCHVVDAHFKHTQRFPLPVDFLLAADGISIRRIFFRQLLNCRQLLFLILNDADLSKGNDASEIGSVFFRYDLVLVDDAEGCLRTALYSVQFVAAFGTVKV